MHNDIETIVDNLGSITESRHWEGCHRTHVACAITFLVQEIESHEANVRSWRWTATELSVRNGMLRSVADQLLAHLESQGVDTRNHPARDLIRGGCMHPRLQPEEGKLTGYCPECGATGIESMAQSLVMYRA